MKSDYPTSSYESFSIHELKEGDDELGVSLWLF